MTLSVLSEKQKTVLKWTHLDSMREKYNAIICDGAVRSGKTIVMSTAYIHWAMRYFDNCCFAICARSIGSAERNIVLPLLSSADITAFYKVEYNSTKGFVTVKSGRRKNRFYLFGGRDEQSYMSIQGLTLCGVLLDEVALMPRSFVEQCIARTLSEPRAKLWFNCNPAGPEHWFYKEWILDAEGENTKGSLYLHFLMTDNPTLTPQQIEKAGQMFSGVFYKRYIEGEWAAADGLVYPMFGEENIYDGEEPRGGKHFISIDYGTRNPCSMGLWSVVDGRAYRIDERYYDSSARGKQLTDEEYYDMLKSLAGGHSVRSIVIDPSAASFIALIRRRGEFNVIKAKNSVIDGIRFTSSCISQGKVMISRRCKDILREFSQYSWDGASGEDRVIKQNDHAMDDMRYFCYTVLRRQGMFESEDADDFYAEDYSDHMH